MTTTTVGSLLIELGMDSAQFERSVMKAEGVVARMSRSIGVSGKEVVAASQRMGVSVNQFGNQVQQLQARLNPTAQALTKYRQEMNLLRESFRIGAISQAQFQQGVQQSVAAYRAASVGVDQANGQMRGGMQQLSFQLNDIATQFAMGTSPMTIFAQQSSQVIQAVQMMNGGTSKLGAFLMGPWGMALTIGAVALTPFIGKLMETAFAADKATKALDELVKKREEEIAEKNKLRDAQTGLNTLLEEEAKLRAFIARQPKSASGVPLFSFREQQRLKEVQSDIAKRRDAIDAERTRRLGLGLDVATRGLYDPTKPDKVAKVKKDTGPTAEEIQRQFMAERDSLMQQYNSAAASMAMSAEEAAQFELANVQLTKDRMLDQINFNENYSAKQKKQLAYEVGLVSGLEKERVERDKQRRLEAEGEQIRREEFQAKADALRTQMSMADTDQQRLNLALELFDLEFQEKENALERIIASETRTDAEKALAQLALDNLRGNRAAARGATARQNQTRVQGFLSDLQKTPEEINQAIDDIKISGLQRLNDELVDALVNFKSLGDVAQAVLKQILADLLRIAIQKAIIGPLSNLLFPGAGLAGARAGGGPVRIGRSYLVGEQGPEIFTPGTTGNIVPNDQLGSMGGKSEVHKPTFVFPGISNAKEAREAATQAARRYRRELNPLRA